MKHGQQIIKNFALMYFRKTPRLKTTTLSWTSRYSNSRFYNNIYEFHNFVLSVIHIFYTNINSSKTQAQHPRLSSPVWPPPHDKPSKIFITVTHLVDGFLTQSEIIILTVKEQSFFRSQIVEQLTKKFSVLYGIRACHWHLPVEPHYTSQQFSDSQTKNYHRKERLFNF